MAADNTVDLVGNMTRAPELRFTPGGMAVCDFGLAVNRRTQNRQTQEWEEKTSFFDIVAYGSLAENVSQCTDRGHRVMVTGRLEQRSWETTEGDKRSKVEVIADDIGPSLRWATADVTRNEKKAEPARNGGRSNSSSGGSRQQAAPRPAAPAGDYDEDPFVLDAFAIFDRYGPQ